MEPPLLECRNVRKDYGALAAVDGVDLTVKAGETIGIGGPNGAGKTTFFDLISGLTPHSGGEVLFQGKSISRVSAHRLLPLGMARTFQVSSGFTSLSVMQNMLVSIIYGSGEERPGLTISRAHRQRASEQLERFGLSHLANVDVAEIPALARKKLMVATAVAHDPKLLLLDEPVGGLVPSEIDDFIEMVLELRSSGICIVFIEHVMRFLMTVAERALIMHQGKLIYDGTPAGIAHDVTVKSVYLGSEADKLQEGAL